MSEEWKPGELKLCARHVVDLIGAVKVAEGLA